MAGKYSTDVLNAIPTGTTGAPVTGTYAKGDHICDSNGVYWLCTVAGTPGTWVSNATSTDIALQLPLTAVSDTKDYTGFIDSNNIDVSYNYTNRTITLTGNLQYYWRGVSYTLTSPWTSTAHTATQGSWYLSTTNGTNFTWSQTVWTFDVAMAAFVYYGASAALSYAIRETHGIMDWKSHEEFHQQVGTYRKSGLSLTAGTYAENTASDAANSPGFDLGVIKDEDCETVIPVWTEGTYTTMYIGAGNVSTFNVAATLPFISAGSYLQYNNTGVGTLVTGQNNRYYNVYQLIIPGASDVNSQKYRMIMVQPQAEYTTLALAQGENPAIINVGSIIPAGEFIFYTRITYVTSVSDNNTGKCRIAAGGITYLVGNKLSQVSISGIAASNHQSLSNLSWTSSGHTGAVSSLALFDASGIATTVLDSTYVHTTGNENIAGIKTFTDTTASTSTITGSHIIGGGVGIAGDINSLVLKSNSATQAAGKFYTGSTTPVSSNLLNYDGYLSVTQLTAYATNFTGVYSGSTSGIGVGGDTVTGTGMRAISTGAGSGVWGTSSSGYGIRGNSSTGIAAYFNNETGNTSNIIRAALNGVTKFSANYDGSISLYGATSGSVSLQSPATPTSYTITMPSAVPTVNGQMLTATTSGIASWTTPAGWVTPTDGILDWVTDKYQPYTTKTADAFYNTDATLPTGTNILKYDGIVYATKLRGDGTTAGATIFGSSTIDVGVYGGTATGLGAVYGYSSSTGSGGYFQSTTGIGTRINNVTGNTSNLLSAELNSVVKASIDKDGNMNIASNARYNENGNPIPSFENKKRVYENFEEFERNIYNRYGWITGVSNNQGSIGLGTPTGNHPGVAAGTTGTNGAGNFWITTDLQYVLGTDPYDLEFIIKTDNTLPVSATDYTIGMGFTDDGNQERGDQNNVGLFIRWTGSAAGWSIQTKNSGTETITNATAPPTLAINTWYRVRINISAGRVVTYYINDVNVGTISTNVPTSDKQLALYFNTSKSTGTTERWSSIDYIGIRSLLNADR